MAVSADTTMTIRTNSKIKKQVQSIYSDLGIDLSTAINVFMRQSIRYKGFPFDVTLDVPNETTAAAIDEGRRIAHDKRVKGYKSMSALKAALE